MLTQYGSMATGHGTTELMFTHVAIGIMVGPVILTQEVTGNILIVVIGGTEAIGNN
jgi:hypothetical protein